MWNKIQNLFGPHSIDLMATDMNTMRDATGKPLRHFTETPTNPIWWPVLNSHVSASVLLGKPGDRRVLYIPTKKGFIRDKIGLKHEMRAFRLHFT